MRSWAYNCFGVLMGTSWRASCPRWPSLRRNSWPMITLFPSQGDFCATATEACSFRHVCENNDCHCEGAECNGHCCDEDQECCGSRCCLIGKCGTTEVC